MWKPSPKILVATLFSAAQYIFGFFIFKMPGLKALHWVGWIIWVLSLIFAFAPMIILRKKGRVSKGESYIHTTELVDTSLYAICRHPQYTSGILFNIAMMFLAQHWLIIGLGLLSATLIYLDIRQADQEGIDKFGVAYELYMQRVPRANFLIGFFWLVMRRNAKC